MDVGTSPERLAYTTDAAGEIDVARDAVYARQTELQSNLKWLRENDTLRWMRPDGYRPFWSVSKHADVYEVARHPEVFLSGPRNQLLPIEIEERIRAIRNGSVTLVRTIPFRGRKRRSRSRCTRRRSTSISRAGRRSCFRRCCCSTRTGRCVTRCSSGPTTR